MEFRLEFFSVAHSAALRATSLALYKCRYRQTPYSVDSSHINFAIKMKSCINLSIPITKVNLLIAKHESSRNVLDLAFWNDATWREFCAAVRSRGQMPAAGENFENLCIFVSILEHFFTNLPIKFAKIVLRF